MQQVKKVENRHEGTWEIARKLDLRHTYTVNKMLIKNKVHLYQIELNQELYGRDYDSKVRYCEIILNSIQYY